MSSLVAIRPKCVLEKSELRLQRFVIYPVLNLSKKCAAEDRYVALITSLEEFDISQAWHGYVALGIILMRKSSLCTKV